MEIYKDFFTKKFDEVRNDSNKLFELLLKTSAELEKVKNEYTWISEELDELTSFDRFSLQEILSSSFGNVIISADAMSSSLGKNALEVIEDEETKSYYITVFLSETVTLEKLSEVINNHFPTQHCKHDYDCCGNWYRNTPTVVEVFKGKYIINFTWHQNI